MDEPRPRSSSRPAELVELYNPADLYAAFAEAARDAGGLGEEPTATPDMLEGAGIGVDEAMSTGPDPYAAAADDWAAAQPIPLDADDDELAAQRLYDLALEFQERSQRSESRLLEQFEDAAALLSGRIGDLIITDDDDERLTLTAAGSFAAEVLDRGGERVAAPRAAPTSSSSTTTRPTSSATWPTRSPRPTRRSPRSWRQAPDATNGTGEGIPAGAIAESDGAAADDGESADDEEDDPRA